MGRKLIEKCKKLASVSYTHPPDSVNLTLSVRKTISESPLTLNCSALPFITLTLFSSSTSMLGRKRCSPHHFSYSPTYLLLIVSFRRILQDEKLNARSLSRFTAGIISAREFCDFDLIYQGYKYLIG